MNNELQDKILVCKDCGQEFFFTVGAEPKRCKSCRDIRKQKFERR